MSFYEEKETVTRPFDKHLDTDELAEIASAPGATGHAVKRLSELAREEALHHCDACTECRRKVQMHMVIGRIFTRSRLSGTDLPGPDCSSEMDWQAIVEGLEKQERTEERLTHAAQCDHCGSLLKDACALYMEESTPEEEAIMATLESTKSDWQLDLIARMRESQSDRGFIQRGSWWRPFFALPRTAFAVAALIALMVIAYPTWRWFHPASADQLLADSYTERRTLEVRIPGASYAPLRVERGSGASSVDKPRSLHQAEDLIANNLERHPNDPDWLDAKGRAYLLEGQKDDNDLAIQVLKRALETKPDSPKLLLDLGTAYFQRASASDRAIDYGNAIESLGEALSKTPDDPIALFNRALACERMFLYSQAVDDWEHYLRVDPDSEWSQEARKRLAMVQGKLKDRQKSLATPLLTPETIANSDQDARTLSNQLDERVEQYTKTAVTEWIPAAFSDPTSTQPSATRSALKLLAGVLVERHNDPWLYDLLHQTTRSESVVALKTLSAAILAHDRGDYSAARTLANSAAQQFQAVSNEPGLLRAQAEEVYAEDGLLEGPPCVLLIRSIVPPIHANHYEWLEAHLSLEESNCSNRAGDLGTYQAAIDRGNSEALNNKYPEIYLRGVGFKAEAAASMGDADSAMALAREGLERFWRGNGTRMLGYNLYTDLDTAADDLRLPNFQVALWREATELIDPHPNVLQRAMAHSWYGNAAYLAGMPALAAAEFAKESQLLSSAPQTVATLRDRMDAQIWLATIEARQGDLKQAASHLEEVSPVLAATPSFGPEIGFYTVQSQIALAQSNENLEESSLQRAIFLAEWALRSFPSEADRSRWAEQIRDAYQNAVEWELRRGDGAGALELWEWYRGAELRTTESPARITSYDLETASPPNLKDAPPLPSPDMVSKRKELSPEGNHLVYAAFPDGIAVWVYDRSGIDWNWIPMPLPRFRDLVNSFRRLCSDPQSDIVTLQLTGRSLYDLLVAPVQNRIGRGRSLTIEPDDDLAAIPWEALVDPAGRYLAERGTIIVTPGIYRQMRLRPSISITSQTPALIVSVSSAVAEELPPLPDADEEAHYVAGSFSSSHWLQNENATRSAILRRMRLAAVFHFAGHALANSQRNGLVLAEIDPATRRSRLIDSSAIAPADAAHLQLAVLSACGTGDDGRNFGSGTENLTRALLRAGVPHIIVSRWSVESTQTAVFMHSFYTQLLSGHDAANSLHTTQQIMASQPATSHPFYWSAFEMQGNP